MDAISRRDTCCLCRTLHVTVVVVSRRLPRDNRRALQEMAEAVAFAADQNTIYSNSCLHTYPWDKKKKHHLNNVDTVRAFLQPVIGFWSDGFCCSWSRRALQFNVNISHFNVNRKPWHVVGTCVWRLCTRLPRGTVKEEWRRIETYYTYKCTHYYIVCQMRERDAIHILIGLYYWLLMTLWRFIIQRYKPIWMLPWRYCNSRGQYYKDMYHVSSCNM